MKTVFLMVVLTVAGSVIWGIINLGVFKNVEFENSPENTTVQFQLLGVSKNGAYHEINETLLELEKWAAEKNFNCNDTFGLYYDNPDVVEPARLRADVGCVIRSEDFTRINAMNLTEEKILKKDLLKRMTLSASQILTARFGGSPWIGPYKVYSKAQKKFYEMGATFQFPVLEIYKTKEAVPHTEYLFFLKAPEIRTDSAEPQSTNQ